MVMGTKSAPLRGVTFVTPVTAAEAPMTRISDSTIADIKARADIVDILSEHTSIPAAQDRFMVSCPLHDDRTPSCHIDARKKVWFCHGACQRGGDAIGLWQELHNVTFAEACEQLAHRYGIALDHSEPTANQRRQARVRQGFSGKSRPKTSPRKPSAGQRQESPAPPEAPADSFDSWEHFPPGTAQRVADCWFYGDGEQQISEWAGAITETCPDEVIAEAFLVLDAAEQIWDRQVQAGHPEQPELEPGG